MSDTRIKALRCQKCDKVIVPPRNLCPYCRQKSVGSNIVELENEGTVISFTELHKPPEGFNPPLMLALVELEYGATVLCLGSDNSDSTVEIGSKVILSPDSENRLRFTLV
jgi:uncharacterized OB-fold protein